MPSTTVPAAQMPRNEPVCNCCSRYVGDISGAVPLVADDGRLLGVVPEGAVIGAYLDEIRSLRQEENAGA